MKDFVLYREGRYFVTIYKGFEVVTDNHYLLGVKSSESEEQLTRYCVKSGLSKKGWDVIPRPEPIRWSEL